MNNTKTQKALSNRAVIDPKEGENLCQFLNVVDFIIMLAED